MGYSTDFVGELKFKPEMSVKELGLINQMLGEDTRDLKQFTKYGNEGYIQFELLKDYSGIKWDGGEKFYEATDAVNFIIKNLRKVNPDFGFIGELKAQGEDMEDRWFLRIGEDGWAHKVDIIIKGKEIKCPHCDHKFTLEEEQ